MADLVPVVADVIKSTGAVTDTGTAGMGILAGELLYLESATQTLKLAIASSAAAAAAVGIALHSSLTNQPVTYIKGGNIILGCAIAVAETYCVTDVAGDIGLVSDRGANDYMTLLGVGSSITEIELRINRSGVKID